MRTHVLRATALVACVAAVLLVVLVLVNGFVKADTPDFDGLVTSLREAGITLSGAELVQEDATTVAAFTVLSESGDGNVTAADKAAEEKILREAQQFKDKGLKAGEVGFTVLNQKGETILAVRVPLDRNIDPSWYTKSAVRDAEVETWARNALVGDPALEGLDLAGISVGVETDGARALDLHFVVHDLASGQQAITNVMRDFRWEVNALNQSKGAQVGLVRISVVDAGGASLAEFVADLQLQHDQAWLAKGVQTPGFGPAPATQAAQ
jgi:hypothetical protein